MGFNKKKVFVTALTLSLAALISAGTLAWFQATDEATNFFQVSTDGEQKPDFKLDLFEHELLADGTLGSEEVEENTYKHVAPGDELPKNPTVRNDGQYDMWVRVKINLFEYKAWEEVLGKGFDFSKYIVGINDAWVLDESTKGTDTLVFYYNAKLFAREESQLFKAFHIPEEFTVDNMPGKFKLNIVAEAIQADNTGDNAKAAFTVYWKN